MRQLVSVCLAAAALACSIAVSGCASSPDGKELELRSEPEFQTGSNLPRRVPKSAPTPPSTAAEPVKK